MIRYFDDFKPGQIFELGRHTITKESILAFAREYDPQPFHTDEEAAKETIYGGLIASGWQTGAIMMRLFWDGLLHECASLGSPGIDELCWVKPVRPGDTLSLRFSVLETIPSRSKPDRGVVRSLSEVLNQHGEVVLTMKGLGMFMRRAPTQSET